MDISWRLPTPPPSSSDEEEEEYTPLTPWIQEVEHSYRNPVPYEPIFRVGDIPKFTPSFELPMVGIDATVTAMTEIFLPDTLLDQWVKCTNRYASAHLPPGRRKEVSLPEILRFLPTIQYMGVVRLPAKQDFFPGNRSDVLPVHHAILLNKTRFIHHIHPEERMKQQESQKQRRSSSNKLQKRVVRT
jgi:hypothetical protein